jgi:hypothetical protein
MIPIRFHPEADTEPNQCVIIAVMHLHREPGYWKSRIP